MKKNITLFLALSAFLPFFAQITIPVPNGNFETNTAISTDGNNHTLEGFRITENKQNVFDISQSGLDAVNGVSGSQALKSTITGALGNAGDVMLFSNPIDISGYTAGTYTFSIFLKTATAPTKRPIWAVVGAFDADNKDISGTLTRIDNGGTLSTNNWALWAEGFVEVTVSVETTTAVKSLQLRFQHATENHTFWFDNITLTTTATLSTKDFQEIGVSMYPNPVSSTAFIKSNTGLENITLYSLTGKLLLDKKVSSNEYNLDVSSFAKGVYFLGVTNSKGKSVSKLIVQ